MLRNCSILEIWALNDDCWFSLSWEQEGSQSDSEPGPTAEEGPLLHLVQGKTTAIILERYTFDKAF